MSRRTLFSLVLFFLVLILASAMFAPMAHASPGFLVTTTADPGDGVCDATCSLRDAIIATNANPGTDLIIFNVSGTITLGSALPAISDDVTIDGTGQTVTVDGASTYQMMTVNSGKTVTLDTLTLADGLTAGSGAAVANNGTLHVTHSTFSANSASYGGAIYNNGGTLTVTHSTFSGNSSALGGAIWNDGGTLNVTDSTFSANQALSPLGGGGAIENNNSGGVTILNSTFSANLAIASSNSAGGGIDNSSGTLTVTNSTFTGNYVDFGDGGGIKNGGTLNVTNSTFLNNQQANSGTGGGIYNGGTGTATLRNTIVAGSTGGDCSGTFTADAFNLDTDGSCNNATTKTTGQINLATPPTNNGGPTFTMALQPPSAAINAGDDSVCAATVGSPNFGAGGFDQRGVARPVTGCDVGAFELVSTVGTQPGPNFVVNVNADTDDGSCDLLGQGSGNQDCTLREAINAANALAGSDTVTFSFSGTITLGSTLPPLNDDVTIDGTGQTITVNGANAYQVFAVNSGKTVTLKLLTVAHGSAQLGGGVNNAGTLTVIDSTFSENRATTLDFNVAKGGAISNSGTLDVRNSTFSGNLVGIDTNVCDSYGGAINNSGTATVTNSTFSGNLVYSHCHDGDGHGGAIYNDVGHTLSVTNSTISGNDIVGLGLAGGLLSEAGSVGGGTLNLRNTILANNGAYEDCVSTQAVGTTVNNIIVVNGAGGGLDCGAASSADPLLNALGNNGGPTQTFALQGTSPALGAGDDTVCAATVGSPNFGAGGKDQRGLSRPVTGCDVGAFELQAVTCAAGQYNDGGSCVDAPKGYYVDTPGATAATPCDPGYYQDQTGQTSCKQADPGYYVPTSAQASQTPCASGATSNAGSVDCPIQSGPGFVVNVNADTDDGECDFLGQGTGNKDCTLREAIHAANALAGADTITFSISSTEITLTSELPHISEEVTIDGTGQDITVSGDDLYPVFFANGGAPLTLDALTISHGNTTFHGGGVYASDVLKLTDVIISFSVSSQTGGGVVAGGAAYVSGSTFMNNEAHNGGGGGAVFLSTAAMTDTLIIGNQTDNNHNAGGAYFTGAATLKNVTFQNNSAGNLGGGGAVFNATSNLTDGLFMGNVANFAGGGAYFGGAATIDGTTFSQNTASANRGGGAYFNDTALVQNASFRGNHANADRGGGAYFRSGADLTATDFYTNTASDRAGGAYFFVTAALTSTNFYSNTATARGGGAYFTGAATVEGGVIQGNQCTGTCLGGGAFVQSTLTLNKATFDNNTTDRNGGGIYNNAGLATVTNSTFSGNDAGAGGGGIFNNGALDVGNSTFSGNTAGGAGGIYNSGTLQVFNSTFAGSTNSAIYNVGPSVTTTLKNTLLANQVSGGNCFNNSGTFTIDSFNLSDDNTCPGATQKTSVEIALGPLASNGGPTKTMALGATSVAINAGDNNVCAAAPVNNLDQRGTVRPQGPTCDVGAYELVYTSTQSGPNFVVNHSADTDDGSCDLLGQGIGNQDCTLREAINAANARSGADTITFNIPYPADSGCTAANTCTITLTSLLPNLNDDVTINGAPNSGKITVSGNSLYRPFLVNSGKNVTLDTLTIANGNSAGDGGGIYNNDGTLTVLRSTIMNNTATGDGIHGGGIFNTAGGLVNIVNSTFSGNKVLAGGGDGAFGGAIGNFGTLNVTNSTIAANDTTEFTSGPERGGGIYNEFGTTTLNNTIVANNTGGGDCYRPTGTLTADSYNMDSDGSCNNATTMTSVQLALGALASNGGPTQTMGLGYKSAAIDAGNNTVCANITTVNKLDQRGQTRNDLNCDVGAFEFVNSDGNAVAKTFLNSGSLYTFGPTLAGITSGNTYSGTLTISRVLTAPTNGTPPPGILPITWDVTDNSPIPALIVTLCYDPSVLTGQVESMLHVYHYNGSAWVELGGILDSVTHYPPYHCVTAQTPVTSLSPFALAPAHTTAINVSKIKGAINKQGAAQLRWHTFSESFIAGFNVYRRTGKGEWKKVNVDFLSVKHPGSPAGAKYRYNDTSVKAGKRYHYKVEIVYTDNHSEWSNVVRLEVK